MLIGQHLSELVTASYISKSVSLEVSRERQPVTLIQTMHNDRKIFSSGIGREGARYGIDKYTELKYLCMQYKTNNGFSC